MEHIILVAAVALIVKTMWEPQFQVLHQHLLVLEDWVAGNLHQVLH
jgi:hypothetical protein